MARALVRIAARAAARRAAKLGTAVLRYAADQVATRRRPPVGTPPASITYSHRNGIGVPKRVRKR